MANSRDSEMGAFRILAILVVLVLFSVILYYGYLGYQRNKAESQGDNHQLPPASEPQTTSATKIRTPRQAADIPTPPPAAGPLSHNDLVLGGLPVSTRGEAINILPNIGYVSGYSEERRNPLYVSYRVFAHGYVNVADRPGFRADPRSSARIETSDYTGSGFDRGHMAPNHAIAACWGPKAQTETFFMTNITPQRATLNQKVWEGLERTESDAYAKKFDNVWIIDGPIFSDSPRTIGFKKIQVPDAFYKILIENKSGAIHTMQIIMPQDVVESDRGNLAKFTVTIRDIESKTGLNFFPDLPQEEQDRIETVKSAPW